MLVLPQEQAAQIDNLKVPLIAGCAARSRPSPIGTQGTLPSSMIEGEFIVDGVELSHDNGDRFVAVNERAPRPGDLERGVTQRSLDPFCDRLPAVRTVRGDRDHVL